MISGALGNNCALGNTCHGEVSSSADLREWVAHYTTDCSRLQGLDHADLGGWWGSFCTLLWALVSAFSWPEKWRILNRSFSVHPHKSRTIDIHSKASTGSGSFAVNSSPCFASLLSHRYARAVTLTKQPQTREETLWIVDVLVSQEGWLL